MRSQAGVFLLTRVVPSYFHEKNLKINPLVYCATQAWADGICLFNDLQKVLVIGTHDTRLLTHTFLMGSMAYSGTPDKGPSETSLQRTLVSTLC